METAVEVEAEIVTDDDDEKASKDATLVEEERPMDRRKNPLKKIQTYLKAPEPIAPRSNSKLDGTVLVSGYVKTRERTDQTIFNCLNGGNSMDGSTVMEGDTPFNFERILAHVDDSKFAKKRLISRSSRYSGLLNKLDFVQAEQVGALPTLQQLTDEKVGTWVAYVACKKEDDKDCVDTIREIARLATESEVTNVAVLLTDAQDLDAKNARDALSLFADIGSANEDKKFTIVAVGAIDDDAAEGSVFYKVSDIEISPTDAEVVTEQLVPADASFSRDDGIRIVAECLGLQSAENRAVTFTVDAGPKNNSTSARLVKGLREAGYTRSQEIDHMMDYGLKSYEEAIEKYNKEFTDDGESVLSNFLDSEAKKEKEKQDRLNSEKADGVAKSRDDELNEMAQYWAETMYFRKKMREGTLQISEDEYVKSVWDMALKEADKQYRKLHGEDGEVVESDADARARKEKQMEDVSFERLRKSVAHLVDDDDEGEGGDDNTGGDI